MGRTYEVIDADLAAWIDAQPVLFVATAPTGPGGHVNCSPKGVRGTFRILDEHRVALLDLTGSTVETVAHVRQNGRITLMWCAFEGAPRIVRLHGQARVVSVGQEGFAELVDGFGTYPAARAVLIIEASRITDSCGFGVPLMELQGERTQLDAWARAKGPDGLTEYQATRNTQSIDGLPGLDLPAADGAGALTAS